MREQPAETRTTLMPGRERSNRLQERFLVGKRSSFSGGDHADMSAAPALPPLTVDRHASSAEMAEYLSRDRLFTAYALADLDPANIQGARWWLARRGTEPVAGALTMVDLTFRPLFLAGDPEGAAFLLREVAREPRVVVAAPLEHRPAVEAHYRLERVDRMLRMVVDAASFRPADGSGVRLTPAHIDELIDLYGLGSRTYFTPRRLQQEVYYGIFDGPFLVAAAGTHVRSAQFGIAAVGNVLTRLAYRGRGLGRACTSAVTAACLTDHRDVVLNVRDDNAAAIAVYRRLGYTVYRPFLEGPGYRRGAWDRIAHKIFRLPTSRDGEERR
jgi:ribosomal protein S18 acetylase RimI-like enzyme